MKFKKIAAGALSLSMLASLAGCGSTTPNTGSTTTTAAGNGGEDIVTSSISVGEQGGNTEAGLDSNDTGAPTLQELYGDETIEITIFSQLANYSGELKGWFADLMKEKFNCIINIIPDSDGMFDTRMAAGSLGDIVIFGSNGDQYQQAATSGMLFDWNDDDILSDYGPYIKANMPYALQNNANLNQSIGVGDGDVVYGFGHNVATSPNDHEAFIYTMDVRYDLYKELGYPELKDLDDFYDMLVQMKEICPKDEMGNETYAVSLWPDWDGTLVMYVKSFATCYWGYEGDMGMGHYDVETGDYYFALDENSPYLQSLKFFNKLYRAGLIDPDSMTQTYTEMSEKVTAGGTFFSIFDYAGSQLFNTEEHLAAGKAMYPVVTEEMTPLCAGMNVFGGSRLWTIGANTEYPELCMSIINYLCTPEGYLTYWYGPKADGPDDAEGCWYYDEEGNTCFTELGEAAYKDRKGTTMPGGISFDEGTFQANNTTWTRDATNPDSNGETYNCENWKSRRGAATSYEILDDWREHTGCYNSQEYMNTLDYKVLIGTSFKDSKKSDDFTLIWNQVTKAVVSYSWQAIYSDTEEECDKHIEEMIAKWKEYDPDGQMKTWCENEASIRKALDDQAR